MNRSRRERLDRDDYPLGPNGTALAYQDQIAELGERKATLNLSGRDFADQAGIGYATLARFEAGSTIADESRDQIVSALDRAGAQFTRKAGRVGVTVPE